MSNIVELVKNITSRSEKFVEYNSAAPTPLDFEQECLFARQALTASTFLCSVAEGNQQSLIDAIYQVASIGISLNPSRKHAYLVPRKVGGVMKVCLDISYIGLLRLATDTGVTKYMKGEIVHENDNFDYHGFDQRPTLSANLLKDRGDAALVYAMAILHDGSVLVEYMTIDEVMHIRDDTEAYKSVLKKHGVDSYQYANLPWVKYEGEMIKKTILKRAFKTLPETKGKQILDNAMEIVNEHEGIVFENNQVQLEYKPDESVAYLEAINSNDHIGLLCLRDSIGYEGSNQLWKLHEEPRIEKGGKGKYDKLMQDNIKAARELRDENLTQIVEMTEQGDNEGVNEILEECNSWERDYYRDHMPNGLFLETLEKKA